MPARVVVVHDDPDYVDELAALLRRDGHDVAAFPDPLASWDAVEAAKLTEVLVTRVDFPPGRFEWNGTGKDGPLQASRNTGFDHRATLT
jgi:DNA-binding NtrC family response regulator